MKDTEREIRQRTNNPLAEVLPIILYSDGVQVGMTDSVYSVLGTCGLYSDKLQRKTMAKFNLGFIESITGLPAMPLIKHLVTVCNYSVSSAKVAIKSFHQTIHQKFWSLCSSSITNHSEKGVRLRMLGGREHHMYPVLAFILGDEPAQKLACSLKSSQSKRPCVQCTFCPDDDEIYSPEKYPNRDFLDTKQMCLQADSAIKRNDLAKYNEQLRNLEKATTRDGVLKKKWNMPKLSNCVFDSDDKEVMDELQSLSVVPIVNAFFDVPMGSDNHIYKTPPDVFHVFCAGLMKSGASWILTIIYAFSKHEGFSNAAGLFDDRLRNFPHTPERCHVPYTFFRNGLMSIAEKKDKKEEQQDTGAGGGYRSGYWITALLHIYHCIGYSGDVLPNRANYEFNGINVGNPTAKVFNLIYSLLNVYFECKRSGFTENQIQQLEKELKSCHAHLTVTWELKRAVTNAPPNKKMRIRKNHMMMHFPSCIRQSGSLSHSNTDTWEASHPTKTTMLYQQVGKRHSTLSRDMTIKGQHIDKSTHFGHRAGVMEKGLRYFDSLEAGGGEAAPAEVTRSRIKRGRHYKLSVGDGTSVHRFSISNHCLERKKSKSGQSRLSKAGVESALRFVAIEHGRHDEEQKLDGGISFDDVLHEDLLSKDLLYNKIKNYFTEEGT
jgi:hypothetical protein